MKTKEQILESACPVLFKPNTQVREAILSAMEEYAQQALESYKGDVLDEFEKWVESAFVEKIGGERVFNETFLLSKIRSLKTKTI